MEKTYCGGVGQIVKRSRDSLQELGYEVYVLISSAFVKKFPVRLLLPDGSLQDYGSLGAFLKEHSWYKFGIIIHHFVNWTRELKQLRAKEGRRPKIIYHFHSILRRERDCGFRTLNNFLLAQEKMIALADRIVCPSAYEYDNFARYFPVFIDKVVLIENTIEHYAEDRPRIREIRTQHAIKPRDVVSLYVGRLERIKGSHILLHEASRVLQRSPHRKLFFVGKSLEPDLYRKLLQVRRNFPRQFFYKRYLEKKELFQYYYMSDIYINCSLSESFSLSTHEGALCNNTLLLSRLPVFEKFKNGALFFDAREGDFGRKYERLARDPDLRKRLSRRAGIVARKFLGQDRLRDDLKKLLHA